MDFLPVRQRIYRCHLEVLLPPAVNTSAESGVLSVTCVWGGGGGAVEENRLSQPGMPRPKGQHEMMFMDGGSILGLG